MMGLCYWYAVKYNWPVEEIFQWGKLWRAFKDAFWALTLPIIILGGIFGGVVTATEGAALAVVAALFVGGVIYRDLNWARLREAIIDGTVQTGTVMLLVAASALLGLYLTEAQLPQTHRARRCSPSRARSGRSSRSSTSSSSSSACSCTRRPPSSWWCRS